ncbi:hypothetical protein U14_03711 [Candidatus Moduliflexus flocculans]|uniref:Uncharacterized protein n=1 Tax=Candidatus Moduliflexus flocculans TaxID=1499966 RepID=A0A081BPZ4_9BACT|nr:hypothetical protein U14_03711 [Candidatus Moduliflexus flocculans]
MNHFQHIRQVDMMKRIGDGAILILFIMLILSKNNQ